MDGVKPVAVEGKQQKKQEQSRPKDEVSRRPAGGKSLKGKMGLAILVGKTDLVGPEVAIFKFKPKEGEVFPFRAGQYATLALDVNGRFIARAYSIVSSPYTRNYLEFYINIIKGGQLTPALFSLSLGDEVYYMGPKGVFALERTKSKNLLFVATGTGLAPYMSMLRKLHADQCEGRPQGKAITLIHGVRHSEDLGYREEIEALSYDKEFNLLYLPIVSRTGQDPLWTPALGKGRVTDLLRLIREKRPDKEREVLPCGLDPQTVFQRFPRHDTAVYLCGNPDMTAEARQILTEKGYQEIYTEDYW